MEGGKGRTGPGAVWEGHGAEHGGPRAGPDLEWHEGWGRMLEEVERSRTQSSGEAWGWSGAEPTVAGGGGLEQGWIRGGGGREVEQGWMQGGGHRAGPDPERQGGEGWSSADPEWQGQSSTRPGAVGAGEWGWTWSSGGTGGLECGQMRGGGGE